jgi:hypothetical protein
MATHEDNLNVQVSRELLPSHAAIRGPPNPWTTPGRLGSVGRWDGGGIAKMAANLTTWRPAGHMATAGI